MLAVKGHYDGNCVTIDRSAIPVTESCDVIVTFLEAIARTERQTENDGSLKYLFKDYVDDGIRESLVDFGEAIGNEKW
jgi:hypothetical protein